jgi:transcriptional regulator with XRE-family HTH domain
MQKGPAPELSKDETIGARLVRTRKVFGMQQNEFAESAKIRRGTYTQWELGVRRPNLDDAIKLVMTYRLTLDWIYLGIPTGLPPQIYTQLALPAKSRLTRNDQD